MNFSNFGIVCVPVCAFVHVCVFCFWNHTPGRGTSVLPESTGTEGAMMKVTGSLWPDLGVGWPVL